MIVKTLSPPLFDLEDPKWLEYYEQYGFSVIQNILEPSRKEEIYNEFKDDLLTVSPNFDFEDNSSWVIENTPTIFSKGVAVFNGFGQSNFMWSLRTEPKIQEIFKRIYKCNELVTSLDGFSLFVSQNQKSSPWLHIDQNPHNETYSVQGQYNFKTVNNEDAGFIVIPESHKDFNPIVKNMKDWYVLKNEEIESFPNEPVKLLMPENCFTIWNSRTVHANTHIVANKSRNLTDINRVTAYVAFLPEELRTEDIKRERINAYINGETTSHWANKCEIKKYPWGFGPTYEKRGFGRILPKLSSGGEIPNERFKLL